MKKNLLPIILLVTSFGYLSAQSTGIGTTKPDASARLDLSSNNQGVLIPRISLTSTTVASPVTSPATSLMVYNTATINNVTPGYYYWDGTQWVRFQMAVAGAGGNTILNGTSAPVTTTGNVGDFYINTATNQIFGPKTTSGWGVGTSLV
ncbi:MAG: hypothetical protein KBA33_09525 [Cloacibacterium sp.]|nr:hypothetical protein [Cloacibacterium sp.]